VAPLLEGALPHGPRPVAPSLSGADREALSRLARRPRTAQALAMRARIVLACADLPARTNGQMADELGVHRVTVGVGRKRFAERGLDGLLDEPRPGAPRTITDEAIERVLTLTVEGEPEDATHWSTRGMARASGMSQSTIRRIWRAFGLQPHRSETFKLSRDPFFIEKVRDIVGLDLAPPDRALVLCVDEKPQIQALEPTAPVLPMRPGQVERRTHD
jgi:transposase